MEEQLTEIPGIADAIADIVTKLYRTGTHPSLEKKRIEIPAGVLELLDVPGLRPEKVLRLYKDLGITSLAELRRAKAWEPSCRQRSSRIWRSRRGAKRAFIFIGPPPCPITRWRRFEPLGLSSSV